MRRSSAALLTGLVLTMLLAGCSTGLQDSPAPKPTGACDPQRQHVVDPVRDSVQPSRYPDPPATRSAASVERYVVAFERAYARNEALSRESTRVQVAVSAVRVTEEGTTWIVELVSRTNTWAAGTPAASATPTVVHGDGPRVPVTYRLTDRALYRMEGSGNGKPTGGSRESAPGGVTVACLER